MNDDMTVRSPRSSPSTASADRGPGVLRQGTSLAGKSVVPLLDLVSVYGSTCAMSRDEGDKDPITLAAIERLYAEIGRRIRDDYSRALVDRVADEVRGMLRYSCCEGMGDSLRHLLTILEPTPPQSGDDLFGDNASSHGGASQVQRQAPALLVGERRDEPVNASSREPGEALR